MHSSFTDNAAPPDPTRSIKPDAAAQDSETLSRLRWRVSQLVLVIASLAVALQCLLLAFTVDTVTYSFASLLLGSLWFALLAVIQGAVRRVSPVVERLGHSGALALFLGFYTRTVVGVFSGARPLGEMAEIVPWFATVYAVAFIIYSGQTALALCSSVVLYTSGLSLFYIAQAASSGAEVVALEASLDLFAANVTTLLTLYVLRRTTEAWTEMRARAEALARLANKDALTGLYNRRYLNQALAEEVSRAKRYDHVLSAALCDIDNFKRVNDDFSHSVGDRVLQEVARILESSVRSVDTVARFGGEEFVLIFPETGAAQAQVVCEKIRQEVEQHPWSHLHPELNVTLSIGIANARYEREREDQDAPETAYRDPEALFDAADLKLYEAKRSGRNQVRL